MKAVEIEFVLACQRSGLLGRRSKVVHDLRPCKLSVWQSFYDWLVGFRAVRAARDQACCLHIVFELARNQIKREELIVSAIARTSAQTDHRLDTPLRRTPTVSDMSLI